MTFPKIINFSKQPVDLPDRPSPVYSASKIKEYFQAPHNETKETYNNLIDQLHAAAAAGSIGGKKKSGETSNLQTILDELWTITRERVALGAVGVDQLDPEIFSQPKTEFEVQAKFQDLDEDIADSIKHSVSGKKHFSLAAYPRIIPEGNDLGRFQRAIADATEGSVLSVSDESVYEIPSTINITKKLHIIGNDTEFKTVTDGMDNTIKITGVDGLIISGIRFNQNLKGRTSIHLVNCTNFLISHCFFTGYSKEFAYYLTDGGIKLDDCIDGRILFNTWKDHGFQYTAATADLNRCISVQGTLSDNVTIMGNTFNRVNQGIVIACGNHLVSGNVFKEVKDNVLYMVQDHVSTVFSGNFVDHRYDEVLVIGKGSLIASSNMLKNAPNKFLSISGNVKEVLLADNTIDNTDIDSGQFIYWRDVTYQVDRMVVYRNNFRCPTNVNNFEYFRIGNVLKFIFDDNDVRVATQASQRIIYFNGTIAKGAIRGGSIQGSDSTAEAVRVDASVTDYDMSFENVKLISCRGVFARIRVVGNKVQFNVGPYILDKPSLNNIYADVMPTSGTWTQGDYAINTTPTVSGSTGSKYVIKGWLRVTTGSNNVLNTDWVEDRALTGQ